jgi:hypothetical protein
VSFHLATRPLLTQHDRTAISEGSDAEGVLSNIDAKYGDRVLCYQGQSVFPWKWAVIYADTTLSAISLIRNMAYLGAFRKCP